MCFRCSDVVGEVMFVLCGSAIYRCDVLDSWLKWALHASALGGLFWEKGNSCSLVR